MQNPHIQATVEQDAREKHLGGCSLIFYEFETTNLKDIYTDEEMCCVSYNPHLYGYSGDLPEIYLFGKYTVELRDINDMTIKRFTANTGDTF